MEKKIDYDEPFIVEAIFRGEPDEASGEQYGEEYMEEVASLWMDIVSLRSYPFHSDQHWEKYRDEEKFYITFRETGSFLVLGSFKGMFKLWKTYCKKYYGKDPEDE